MDVCEDGSILLVEGSLLLSLFVAGSEGVGSVFIFVADG